MIDLKTSNEHERFRKNFLGMLDLKSPPDKPQPRTNKKNIDKKENLI
jgi:hypothetical protein